MISPHSVDLFTKLTTGNFHPRNLPPPPEDTVEAYLADQHVIPACPRCGGTELKKNGKQANRQRLRCKRCGKTFGLSSGTHFYRSHLPFSTWRAIISGFERRMPLREIADQTGVSVHTLCKLRQKYLAGHLRMLTDIFETLQEKGLVKDDADLETVFGLIKDEIDKIYRGRSLRVAKERLYRFQKRWLEKQGIPLAPY